MIGWRKQGWIQRRRQTQAVCSSYVIVMTRAAYLGGSLRHSTLCSRANSDTMFINHSEHRDGGVHLPAISDCSQFTYKGCCMTNYWWELIFKVGRITFCIDNRTHKWMVCVFWVFFWVKRWIQLGILCEFPLHYSLADVVLLIRISGFSSSHNSLDFQV